MGWGDYNIDVAPARAAISAARGRWDDIDGIEHEIELTGEAAATASKEDSINSALQEAFTDFLRPFVVTMIKSGRQTFVCGDNVVTTFENADTAASDVADARQEEAIGQIKHATEIVDATPSYSEKDETGAAPTVVRSKEAYNW